MKLKLICCEVFMRPARLAAARSAHEVDLEFTGLNSHVSPDLLRTFIQEKIDAAGSGYDAVLLGFGLCGNGAAGLRAGAVPLVIPRAHDCCTIFLGSRGRFLEFFGGSLSAEWSTDGYMERGGEDFLRKAGTDEALGIDGGYGGLAEKYGEENARFIWETLHSGISTGELTYITLPGVSKPENLEAFKAYAREKGRKLRVVEGGLSLLEDLAGGRWDDADFLTVPPGGSIWAVYDHEIVMRAGP